MAKKPVRPIWWANDHLYLIDQTKLPGRLVTVECQNTLQVIAAIKEMRVRGAPAIGIAAAYGVALAARQADDFWSVAAFGEAMAAVGDEVKKARPTAVNLAWAVDRAVRAARGYPTIQSARTGLLALAKRIEIDDEEMCRAIGQHGAALVPDRSEVVNILTHCNAGALATAAYGTALGVIRAAHEAGKRIHVYADETRPLLQGARLTAWELHREGIPVTLIADNMAGALMRGGKIDLAVVGADRITANGDVANKIGTYTVAVLCKEHGLPFYVAAPSSTVDLSLATGDEIPIEQRDESEVLTLGGKRIAPRGVRAANPAFDVTPNQYITAIITENGVIRSPFAEGLGKI